MDQRPAPASSPVRRLARTVYDAQADGRSALLDGPWWLVAIAVVATAALTFGNGPWPWLVLPVVVVVLWVPLCVRWALALGRSVRAFREGLRG